MRWVPGHKGLEENERADANAKKVAEGKMSEETDTLIKLRGLLLKSRAAEIQRYQRELKKEAKATLAKSPHATLALIIDPTMPSPVFSKLSSGLACRHASLLMQL